MAFKQSIDFRRLHLEATAIYFILDTASNPNAALFIDQSLVTGSEIALMKSCCGQIGTLIIARHQAGRFYDDFAGSLILYRAALVHYSGVAPPHRSNEAVCNAVLRGRAGNPIGCLGNAVAIDDFSVLTRRRSLTIMLRREVLIRRGRGPASCLLA